MKKICYVLTSEGCDWYSAMTRVSVASVRMSNPGIRIAVACDQETDQAIDRSGDRLKTEVDEWNVFKTPSESPVYRNRYIKTNLRNIIDGPFLFLDSDTIVRGKLDYVFELETDMAAAANHSADDHADQIWSEDAEQIQRMSWQVNDSIYYNGGVLFFRDTLSAHNVAADWHRKWRDCADANLRFRDQAALNAAINDVRPRIETLSHRYNAQILKNQGCVAAAVVWHYYGEADIEYMPEVRDLIDSARSDNEVDQNILASVSRKNCPWSRGYWKSQRGEEFLRKEFLSIIHPDVTDVSSHISLERLKSIDPYIARMIQFEVLDWARWNGAYHLKNELIRDMFLHEPHMLFAYAAKLLLRRVKRLARVFGSN